MKFLMRPMALAIWVLAAGPSCLAQKTQSVYDPAGLFAPGFYTDKAQPFHSANGAPAANYWQNRADYTIKASLDTVKNELSANEVISYTNNSPDTLRTLWLQLDQNTYRADARANFYTEPAPTEFTKGYSIESTKVNGQDAEVVITDTRMQIRLRHPLAPKSGSLSISIHYHYTIPGAFGSRTDWVATRNGKIYEIAQWYPRMCVYDDREGWNTLPFLGSGEFYCEYGDFDYTVTVPAGMIVAGSGELQNPGEVLTKKEQTRLAQAKNSDQTVMIRDAADIGSEAGVGAGAGVGGRMSSGKLRSWHFKMKNTRDVAFGASRAYLWDAARVKVGKSRQALAMSVYPVESAGDSAWGRATEYLKASMEEFSSTWFEYPYPVAINEAGIAGGMEYPGIVFDGMTDKGKVLYWVTAHEIGHNWFPMIVGSDERRYGWMDEGFNTFIDVLASDHFHGGEYAPKRDDEYAPGGGNPADEILPWLKDPAAPMMMTRADAIPEKYRHAMTYFKPAFGLLLLRDAILGKERFDYAFRQYIRNWAFRHPSPVDFFRTMDNEAGEDLSWFWREWYYNNWTLDLAVQDVSYVDGDPQKGARITIANLDRMAMPADLELTWKDGHKERIRLPVETWLQSGVHVVAVPSGQALAQVSVDPDHLLPDENRGNNMWKAGSK
ncbi:MAG: M1 family metallopeptidase [Bacteroidota bacterium]|nr:M1 family metallopeptidase [Bacteroidota bacterium]